MRAVEERPALTVRVIASSTGLLLKTIGLKMSAAN